MDKQERNGGYIVTAKEAADYLVVTVKTARNYHHRGVMVGRQRVPNGRILWKWSTVLRFSRGLTQESDK